MIWSVRTTICTFLMNARFMTVYSVKPCFNINPGTSIIINPGTSIIINPGTSIIINPGTAIIIILYQLNNVMNIFVF